MIETQLDFSSSKPVTHPLLQTFSGVSNVKEQSFEGQRLANMDLVCRTVPSLCPCLQSSPLLLGSNTSSKHFPVRLDCLSLNHPCHRGGAPEGEVDSYHSRLPTWVWIVGLLVSAVFCTAVLTPMLHMKVYEPIAAVALALLVAVLAVRALGQTDLVNPENPAPHIPLHADANP